MVGVFISGYCVRLLWATIENLQSYFRPNLMEKVFPRERDLCMLLKVTAKSAVGNNKGLWPFPLKLVNQNVLLIYCYGFSILALPVALATRKNGRPLGRYF